MSSSSSTPAADLHRAVDIAAVKRKISKLEWNLERHARRRDTLKQRGGPTPDAATKKRIKEADKMHRETLKALTHAEEELDDIRARHTPETPSARELTQHAAFIRNQYEGLVHMGAIVPEPIQHINRAIGILNIVCAHCKGVPRDDIVVSSCGHMMCLACVPREEFDSARINCPTCKKAFNINLTIRNNTDIDTPFISARNPAQ